MKDYFEQTNEDVIHIELKNKMVTLKLLPFDTDIDVDEILKIDYHNVVGEILTYTVIFNRIANLKAEMENIVAVSKVDLESYEAQLFKQKRKDLIKDAGKATEAQIDAEVKNDANYVSYKKLHLERVKNLAYLDSLYWASQNKCSLLKSMSDKLRPEEFMGELLSDTINGVMIKANKKLIN